MSAPTLADAVGSRDFLARFASLAEQVRGATDAGEIAFILEHVAELSGADSASFASVVNDDERYESYRFILAGDPCWCLEYEAKARYLEDPWLEYSRRNGEPAIANLSSPGSDKRLTLPAPIGAIASALVAPALSPRGLTRCGCLALGSQDPEYFCDAALPALKLLVQGLSQDILAWQVCELRSELLERARLSREDLQLLALELQAKSSKEAAKLLASTPISVDSRWQRLKARMHVSSRKSATRLATECGLV